VYWYFGLFLVLWFSPGKWCFTGTVVCSWYSGFLLVLNHSTSKTPKYQEKTRVPGTNHSTSKTPKYQETWFSDFLLVLWFSPDTVVFPVSLGFSWCCGFLLVIYFFSRFFGFHLDTPVFFTNKTDRNDIPEDLEKTRLPREFTVSGENHSTRKKTQRNRKYHNIR
jgi:hypothetical protein